jgi:hypothetical protein
VRPQTGQGLALDEVEKLAAKLSPVGYDVVMNLILTAWVSMNPKTAAGDRKSEAAVFGVYRYCQKLKTQQDELNA